MGPKSKVARLGEIEENLRKKVTELELQLRPSTPTEVLEEWKHKAMEFAENIEEVEPMCAKFVDQISQAREVLIDDA